MAFGVFEQENLLAFMAFDETPGGAAVARTLLPEECFDTFYRRVFTQLSGFIDRYRRPPGEHTTDLIQQLKDQYPDHVDHYDTIGTSLRSTWEANLSRDFVYNRARLFGQGRRIRRAAGVVIDELEDITEEGVMRAQAAFRDALKDNDDVEDIGVSTRDPTRFLDFYNEEQADTFITGIPELDDEGLGPTRGEIYVLGGSYGSGKSWGLLNQALSTALLSHEDVLYIPLEMNEARCCQRVVQMVCGMGTKEREETFFKFAKDDMGRAVDMEEVLKRVPSIWDNERKVRRKMEGFKRRARLHIKSFSSGTFTPQKLRALLDTIVAREGWVPAHVLVDYVGIMKVSDVQHRRETLGQHIIDMRGIGQDYNAAMSTAFQLNRSGMDGNARGKHAAEDISVLHTADTALIYNQTPDEEKLGIARLFVDKGRNAKGGFEVLVSQSYSSGQYRIDSARVHTDHSEMVKREVA